MIRLTGRNMYGELCSREIIVDAVIGNNGDRIIDRWIDASEEKIRRISAEAALNIVEDLVNDERSMDAVKKAFTLAAPAVSGSIGKYLDRTIEDMELGKLTKEKIDSLDAYDIEKLVRSFADKVFHKLYALGAAGVVFGINTYATIVIAVYYLIKEKKKK
jgi:uncharacterized membrane protein YheB (UPF0754 family)